MGRPEGPWVVRDGGDKREWGVEVLLTLQPRSSRLSQGVTQWLKRAGGCV